jgi:hypothetical protein
LNRRSTRSTQMPKRISNRRERFFPVRADIKAGSSLKMRSVYRVILAGGVIGLAVSSAPQGLAQQGPARQGPAQQGLARHLLRWMTNLAALIHPNGILASASCRDLLHSLSRLLLRLCFALISLRERNGDRAFHEAMEAGLPNMV